MLTDCDPAAVLNRSNPFTTLFQEIAEIAQAKLRRSSYLELRDVCCDFCSGILTLRGCVPSYHLKQLAQANVAEVPGVLEVDNRVEVVTPPTSQDHGRWEQEALASIPGSSQ
jgi:osmotically-inducible protein OsmY